MNIQFPPGLLAFAKDTPHVRIRVILVRIHFLRSDILKINNQREIVISSMFLIHYSEAAVQRCS